MSRNSEATPKLLRTSSLFVQATRRSGTPRIKRPLLIYFIFGQISKALLLSHSKRSWRDQKCKGPRAWNYRREEARSKYPPCISRFDLLRDERGRDCAALRLSFFFPCHPPASFCRAGTKPVSISPPLSPPRGQGRRVTILVGRETYNPVGKR